MRARTVFMALGAVGALVVACGGGGPGGFDGFDFYQSGSGKFEQGGTTDTAKPTNDPEATSNDPGSCIIQAGTYTITVTKVSGGDQCPPNLDIGNGKQQTTVIKQGGSLSDLVKQAQAEDGCTVVVSGCTASFHCTSTTTTTTTSSGRDGGTTTTTTTTKDGPAVDETIVVRGDAIDGTITIEGCTYSFHAVFQSSDTSDQNQNKPGGGDAGTGSSMPIPPPPNP